MADNHGEQMESIDSYTAPTTGWVPGYGGQHDQHQTCHFWRTFEILESDKVAKARL